MYELLKRMIEIFFLKCPESIWEILQPLRFLDRRKEAISECFPTTWTNSLSSSPLCPFSSTSASVQRHGCREAHAKATARQQPGQFKCKCLKQPQFGQPKRLCVCSKPRILQWAFELSPGWAGELSTNGLLCNVLNSFNDHDYLRTLFSINTHPVWESFPFVDKKSMAQVPHNQR